MSLELIYGEVSHDFITWSYFIVFVTHRTVMGDYTHASSSASGKTMTYSTRLADASYLGSFPEKSIHRKVLNAVPEEGDVHYLNSEDKGLLSGNKDSLIANKDVAWYRWYISKLEQKRESKKNEEIRKMAEEERQKKHMLQKQKLEDKHIHIWLERKAKEDAARRKEDKAKQMDLAKELENERQKKERHQKMAERVRTEWVERKDNERKGMDD